MGIAISQVLASLEPFFYGRSTIRMALKGLTEKNTPLVMNLTEKWLYSFNPRCTHFTPQTLEFRLLKPPRAKKGSSRNV